MGARKTEGDDGAFFFISRNEVKIKLNNVRLHCVQSGDIWNFFSIGSQANQSVEVGEPGQDESLSSISTHNETPNIVSATPNTIVEGISVSLPDEPFQPENVEMFPVQKL